MKKLIVLIAIMGFLFAGVEPEFRGNKFGIDRKEIKENGILLIDEDNTASYKVNWRGHNLIAIYSFYNNKLYAGTYILTDIDSIFEMTDVLLATYGVGKDVGDDVILWFSDDNKTVLRVEVSYEENTYVSVRVVNLEINEKVLELEKQKLVEKL